MMDLPRAWKFVIGVAGCAIVAHYLPLFFVTITGIWSDLPLNPIDMLFGIVPLIIVSVLGLVAKKVWTVALMACGIFIVYETQHYMRATFPFSFHDKWAEVFDPVAAILANSFLLSRYIVWMKLLDLKKLTIRN